MPDQKLSVSNRSEHSLVLSVASGDDGAAGELFRIYGDSVLRFVYRRVGDQMEDAEEITLDTFGSAVKLAATYDVRATVLTWLCGIAKLRIIDFHRKACRNKRIPAIAQEELDHGILAGPIEDVLDRIEAERVVDHLLSTLSDDEREVLLLRYVEQHSVKEIAALMKRSEKGVESLLTRAKSKPRESMCRWIDGGIS